MTDAHRPPSSVVMILVALALLAVTVAVSVNHALIAGAGVLALVIAFWTPRLIASWPRCIAGLVLVVMLIPIDRYTVAGASLPFQLEPYRLVLGLLVLGWIGALLVDSRVRI